MPYQDLREFLDALGTDLCRVAEPFDPKFEMAAFLHEVQGSGRAVLFEQVRGYPDARVAGNLFASRRLLARALDASEETLAETYLSRKEEGVATTSLSAPAPVQEIVHREPADLRSILPVLTHHDKDAAPYITCGLLQAKDPETGRRAMGVHRLMLHPEGNRLGVLIANPPLSVYHQKAEARGEALDVAISLGVDPATLLASVVKAGPTGPDKFEIAGALRGAPLELTPAQSVALDVPARAEAVIEGRLLPGVRRSEGPFGENTGYYFTNQSPVIEITAVTHRSNLIFPSLCPWTADVDHLLSLAAGTELLGQLQSQVYGVLDVELVGGTCGFSAAVQVKDCSPTEVRRLILLALSSDRRLKTITVVDDDVNIRDPREVSWALATRCQPDRDAVVVDGIEGYVIDPSAQGRERGSKIGFDATRGPGSQFDKVSFPSAAVDKARRVRRSIRDERD